MIEESYKFKLSVIIPLYIPSHLIGKIKDFLIPNLESFNKFTEHRSLEVIYVANGCDKRVGEVLHDIVNDEKYSHLNIKFLWFDKALGYSVATNNGIKISSGEIILLYNDDCILLDQPKNLWIDQLLLPFNNEKVGIAGIHKQYDEFSDSIFSIGYFLGVRKKMLDQIGLLDEIFSPASCEEIDLALRAKKYGWELHFIEEGQQAEDLPYVTGWFPLYHEAEVSFSNLYALGDNGAGQNEMNYIRNRSVLKYRKESGYYNPV